jgi:hypothetical protein
VVLTEDAAAAAEGVTLKLLSLPIGK